MQTIQLTQHEIDLVIDFMRTNTGNDFSEKRALVNSKMGLLCGSAGYKHFWELWDALQHTSIASASLRQQVMDELTTSYSYFNREKAHFKLLGRLVAEGALPVGAGELRVWSAGCATGEEPYNIAMALEDARLGGTLLQPYRIVGSDISTQAISTAREARYDFANVARMPPHWRTLYCLHAGQEFHIKRTLQNHVEFRHENVLSPRPDTPFDVVVCRNMLIYFDRESVERFCTLARTRVKPSGYLLLGHTEIMSRIDGFSYVEPSVWRRDGATAQ